MNKKGGCKTWSHSCRIIVVGYSNTCSQLLCSTNVLNSSVQAWINTLAAAAAVKLAYRFAELQSHNQSQMIRRREHAGTLDKKSKADM
jgi:hypothetical protein